MKRPAVEEPVMVKLAATGGRLLKPAVEKSGLADEQGWNWKIKELKK